jgi:antitoxin ParD1/3/4
MLMPNFEISLPESIKAYVDEQVASRGYSTVSAYFEELVLNDQRNKANKRLESLLKESLESGVATPMTGQDWGAIRRGVQASITQGQHPSDA